MPVSVENPPDYEFAGMYGPETILNGSVVLLPGRTVSVKQVGGTTLATLYADRLKATAGSNPATIDSRGNLAFFATPGQYDLRIITNGVEGTPVTVTVPIDPLESNLDLEAAIAALISIPVLVKAGVPTDADFASTPANGSLAVNSSTNKIYARLAGVWTQVTA